MKHLYILLILLPITVCAQTTSSTVFSSGGAQMQSSSLQLSVTIGQPIAGDRASASLVLHQGFQISNIEAGPTATTEFLQLAIYPNPTAEKLLVTGLSNPRSFQFNWTDLQGRELSVPITTTENQAEFDVRLLRASTYLLRIRSEQGTYQILKVLKIN
ncbi:MAG: T9SS type A sorting domain-containing protein [Cyclobacteriaceae bacterium]|nr:T9SS type A sorting domain-containing protein [Cyclobacteriaceae bacterium]